jgi:hypothetical protein
MASTATTKWVRKSADLHVLVTGTGIEVIYVEAGANGGWRSTWAGDTYIGSYGSLAVAKREAKAAYVTASELYS